MLNFIRSPFKTKAAAPEAILTYCKRVDGHHFEESASGNRIFCAHCAQVRELLIGEELPTDVCSEWSGHNFMLTSDNDKAFCCSCALVKKNMNASL
jgi:hypothetical protein